MSALTSACSLTLVVVHRLRLMPRMVFVCSLHYYVLDA